jgi:CRP-like cAMP-binding protein
MVDESPRVLRRVLALRTFDVLGTAELAELAMLAENMTEASFAAGSVIAPAGARLRALHFIVEGEVATPRRERLGARRVFGVLDVFARRELAAPAVAVRDTRTFELQAADVREILDENFGVLRAMLRELALRVVGRPLPATPWLGSLARPLGFVDRLTLLRRQPMYASATFDALAMLAHASEEVAFLPGATIARAGDMATAVSTMIDGSVHASAEDGSIRNLGSGDSLAFLETLAVAPHSLTFEARTPVRALKQSSAAILDVLEDHTDLGLAMIGELARVLTEPST